MVVDDAAVNLLVARRTLTRSGATVATAGSGEEALRQVKLALEDTAGAVHAHVDVVLMDLQMPLMDGFAATAAIRAHEQALLCHPASPPEATARAATADAQSCTQASVNPAIPRLLIVALTADVDAEITRRCLASGFDGVLQKPVDPKLLAQLLLRLGFPKLSPAASSAATRLSPFQIARRPSHTVARPSSHAVARRSWRVLLLLLLALALATRLAAASDDEASPPPHDSGSSEESTATTVPETDAKLDAGSDSKPDASSDTKPSTEPASEPAPANNLSNCSSNNTPPVWVCPCNSSFNPSPTQPPSTSIPAIDIAFKGEFGPRL
ncbi:unnamed protein product [Closterium sp. NIES-65]|nr:unnamed protein product [Closterium sp. NIES-65]